MFMDKEGRPWMVYSPPRGGDAIRRALVKMAEPKATTTSGLHRAETYQAPSVEGTIVSLSDGDCGLDIGQVVMIGNYSGVPISDDYGERLKVVTYEEIVMVQPAMLLSGIPEATS